MFARVAFPRLCTIFVSLRTASTLWYHKNGSFIALPFDGHSGVFQDAVNSLEKNARPATTKRKASSVGIMNSVKAAGTNSPLQTGASGSSRVF